MFATGEKRRASSSGQRTMQGLCGGGHVCRWAGNGRDRARQAV